MTHEALDLDGADTGVEQIGGEGPLAVMWAEVSTPALRPTIDEGVDGLGGQAPEDDPAGLIDRGE